MSGMRTTRPQAEAEHNDDEIGNAGFDVHGTSSKEDGVGHKNIFGKWPAILHFKIPSPKTENRCPREY